MYLVLASIKFWPLVMKCEGFSSYVEVAKLIGSVRAGHLLPGHTPLLWAGQQSSGYIEPWCCHFVMYSFSLLFASTQLKSLTYGAE